MADDLKVSLGVELDESGLGDVQEKIKKLTNGKDNKIKIELDKSVTTQISNFKKQLATLTNKPYQIKLQIDQGAIGSIQSLTGALNQAVSNAQSVVAQQVKGNVAMLDGGLNGLAMHSQTFKNGSDDPVKDVKKYNEAIGETRTIITDLENKSFTETVTKNYEAQTKAAERAAKEEQKLQDDYTKLYIQARQRQAKEDQRVAAEESKALDYNSKFLSNQDISVSNLESKAFKLNNPLSGDFKAEADKAIEYWKSKIDEARSYTGKLTQEQENALKEAEASARRTVLEQQKSQWQADKLRAKSVDEKVANAGFGLDIRSEELKQTGQYTEEVQQKIEALKQSLGEIKDQKGFDEWTKQLLEFNQQLELSAKQAQTAFKNDALKLDIDNLANRLANVKQKYDEFVNANPEKANAGIEQQFQNIANAIASINLDNIDPNKIKLIAKELRNVSTEVNGLATPAQSLGQILSQNFGGIGQYLARFTSTVFLIQKGVQTVKKMVGEVTSVDSSLVELQKVTTLTGDSLDQFVDKAYKVGEGLGRTGKDVVDAVTTFSRAGYDLNESTQLAQSALVMSNVGVDIPNMEAAASDMISILRAYDKEASESMQVIDELYNVANKEPLDFGNITDMLVTAGGTLAQTNTTLEQTMGLLTGGFATLRDNSVANGLVMISQRLRGVKEDGEAMEADFVPKLKKAFADAGVAIEDQNGELRSTFDILQDLAARWDDLDSKQRQYLGEKAAGNRQVKVLNAIMANWDVVQDTIDKANEATGAATEGNEKYLDSIQGRITAFQSAFQNLARTTIDSGFIKGIVSIGTGIVNITTNLGGLIPVASTLLGLVIAFKGAKIGESISKALPAFAQMFSMLKSGQGVMASLTSLFTSSGFGMVGGVLTAVGVIAAAVSLIKNSMPDLNKKAEESKQTYVEQQQKVEGLNDKLKETQDLLNSMNGKKLTVLEEGEKERLKSVNAELERQIVLENKKLEISERKSRRDAARAGKKKLNTPTSSIASPDLIEAVGGYEKFTEITGRTADESLDPSNFTSMSVLQEAQVRMKALQNAKKEFNIAQAKYIKTDSEDTEALDALEAEKKKWSDVAEESETWLNKTLSDIQNLTEGMSKVENPIPGSLDEYFNKLLDFQAQIEKAILNSAIADMSKSEQFNMILDKYPEQVEKVKEQIKLMGKEVSADSKEVQSAIKETLGKEMIADFRNMGWTDKDVVQSFIESSASSEQDVTGITSVLQELIESNFLATESYQNLSKAMTEQQKAGVITMETYQALISDSGLPGIAEYLTLTAEGFALNTEGIYDYIKAQNDELKLKAISELQDKQAALAQLKEALGGLTDEQERVAQGALIEQTQNEINALEAYIHSLDSAVGALERYKAAKSTANDDEDYKTGQSALKDIQEGWKTGKVGTDDYKEAMGFFLGDSYGTGELVGKKAVKEATKIGNRYFKNEKKGANTFANDLVKAGLATEKDGVLTMNEGVTLDSVASGLAKVYDGAEMSTDAVASLFKLLQTYSETDFEWPEFLTPEEKEAAEERKKKIEELGETETQIKDKIAEKDKEIEEAEKNGEDTTELKQQKSNLEESLKNTTNEKETLESGASVDASTTSLDEAVKKLEELKSTIETLNSEGINVPFSIQGEYDTILQNINTRLEQLETPPTEATITAEDETESAVTTAKENLDSVKQKAETLDPTITVSSKTDGSEEAISEQLDEKFKPRTVLVTVKEVNPDEEIDLKDGETVEEVKKTIEGSGFHATKQDNGKYTWTDPMDYVIKKAASLREVSSVNPNGEEPTYERLKNAIQQDIDSGKLVTDDIQGSIDDYIMTYVESVLAGGKPEPTEPIEEPSEETPSGKSGEPEPKNIEPFSADNQREEQKRMRAEINAEDVTTDGKVEVPIEPSDDSGEDFVGDVQKDVDKEEPVEVPEQPKPVEPPSTPTPTPTPTQTPAPTPAPAQGEIQPVTQTVTMQVDDSEVQAYSVPEKDDGTVKYSHADFSSVSGLTPPTLQGTIKYTAQMPGNATGTSNASKGPSLVDEKGAELIEHISRGTYELGTNKGARLTYLDKGDVVHTAKETKTILSRMAKVGGFFRDGLNKGKSIIGKAFARGISGSISLSNIRRVQSSARSKIKGTDKSKNSSGAKGLSNKKFQQWAEKLFDWAEVRLERLKSVTNGWLLSAAEAIGYIAKNKELSGAIGAVQDEIKATTAAYDLYIRQADAVQKKGKLSNDIVKKIQQGNISIGSYKKEIQEKIKEYQKW